MKRFVSVLMLITACIGGVGRAAEDDGLAPLVSVLKDVDEPAVQLDLLLGMREGLKGRKKVPMPAGWGEVYAKLSKSGDAGVRQHARALAITFGDPNAVEELRGIALANKTPVAERKAAIESLVESQLPGFAKELQSLVGDAAVRSAAILGLAAYDDPQTPRVLLAKYASFSADDKQNAIATLASRRAYATALLDAVEKGAVPRGDVSAFTARQLMTVADDALRRRVREVWGESRETPKDKLDKIARYTKLLSDDFLAKANIDEGRKLYERTCKQCHVLYGEGGKIGPDLTGSNRSNLEYVLTNVIDPSAVIAREYRMVAIITSEGRVLTGMVVERSGMRVTLQTPTEKITLVEEDVEEQTDSPLSMMPEGQIDQLSSEQVRDLVAYLRQQR